MSLFDVPLCDWMSAPLYTVSPDEHLPRVEHLLEDAGVSGVPVVDADFRPIGVISRTDLLHQGAVPRVTLSPGTPARRDLPDRRVGDILAGPPVTIDAGASMADAVQLLREERVHRVLVVAQNKLVGLLTCWDVMRLVATSTLTQPLSALMSGSVVTVPAGASATSASERLQAAHVHGVVVMEREWPVGIFGQDEAIASARWGEPTTVDQWQNASLLALPQDIPVFRAAAQAVATQCHHIVVLGERAVVGIVTPWDFALLSG